MLSVIVAVADNGVIGVDGGLPWRLSADLKRFKRLTMGHHLIIGRRTWKELGRPLPGRTMVVVSRDPGFAPEGAVVVRSLEAALDAVEGDDEPFIGGGAEIYRQAMPLADRLYLTRVHGEPEGDTFLDPLDLDGWRLVSRDHHPADERNDHPQTFEVWERHGG